VRRFNQATIDSSRSPLSTPEKSSTRLNHLSIIEEDVFRDLADPVSSAGSPSRSTSATHDAELEERDPNAIPSRSMTASVQTLKPTPMPSASIPKNPWAIFNALDLWRFFNIWISLLLALQVYASLQIMELQKMAMKADCTWLAPLNFCLIALMSYAALHRRFGQYHQNFISPLAVISIASVFLAISPMIIMFLLR
jgi:hypothetical protein